MKKAIIVSALFLVLFSFAGFCQDGNGFVLKRNEFTFSGAFFQRLYLKTPTLDVDNSAYLSNSYLSSMAGISEYEKSKMTGSWQFAYAYNFSRVFALELGLRYEGYRDRFYNSENDAKTRKTYADILGLMATLRVNWKNKKAVRVYSSAGVGVSWRWSGENYSKSGGPVVRYDNFSRVDWEIAPIGVTIGRGLFFLAEIGVGTVYIGGRFGVGYRF